MKDAHRRRGHIIQWGLISIVFSSTCSCLFPDLKGVNFSSEGSGNPPYTFASTLPPPPPGTAFVEFPLNFDILSSVSLPDAENPIIKRAVATYLNEFISVGTNALGSDYGLPPTAWKIVRDTAVPQETEGWHAIRNSNGEDNTVGAFVTSTYSDDASMADGSPAEKELMQTDWDNRGFLLSPTAHYYRWRFVTSIAARLPEGLQNYVSFSCLIRIEMQRRTPSSQNPDFAWFAVDTDKQKSVIRKRIQIILFDIYVRYLKNVLHLNVETRPW